MKSDQSTGRIIQIPNGWVFRHALANYTEGFSFIWNEIDVTVTYESDWRRAKGILTGIVEDLCRPMSGELEEAMRLSSTRYRIVYSQLTPIVWTTAVDSGVRLTIRYLCGVRNRRSTENDLWEKILDALAKETKIALAYPTIRAYKAGDDDAPLRNP